ncbi:GOLPH3/VPS74 family protein [Actinophytocola sp.]|uniref:GOLPH3/VPS74 family protein n=1 Tax=Actinophytocola sp. TaxID=1872138 RepID=UPI003D6A2B15
MLLAEELLLLALDDETGRVRLSELDKGLAGAVMLELALLERVRVTEKGESGRAGRLVLRTGPAPAHPVLATGLDVLRDREGRKPEYVLNALAKGLRERLADGLVEAGVLRREWHKVLGLFPTRRLPARETGHESAVRERIGSALDGATPDERTAALIALLSALKGLTTVFDLPDKRAARRRAKEIAEGQWAAAAVRKAVEAVYVATISSVTVAAAGDGSGN